MRYNHFSMLPERAFQPRGRFGMTLEGGGGGGPTSSTVTQSNIPEWLRPQTEALLGSATQEYFKTTPRVDPATGQTTYDIAGVKPYTPYSTRPQDYFAGFSPMQQQVQYEAAGMQRPSGFGLGSQYADIAAMGGLSGAGQAMGYGQAGYGSGMLGQQLGGQAGAEAGRRAAAGERAAYGYGTQGAGYGQEASQIGLASRLQAQQDAATAAGLSDIYGEKGIAAGMRGEALGSQAARDAAARADLASALAQRSGAQGEQAAALGQRLGTEGGARFGEMGTQSGLLGQQLGIAAGQRYGEMGAQAGLAGQRAGELGQQLGVSGGERYGGLGAGYGAQAAGLAPQAQEYGRTAADIGQMGLRAESLGRDVGEEARQYARQAAGMGGAYGQMVRSPEAVQAYMSPYQQAVTDVQKQAAIRDYDIQAQNLKSQATRAGAYGGARQAIQSAEAQRGLNAQLQGIQATGLQNAYDKALQQMQFGTNVGLQGLQGAQVGLGTALQGGQLGLSGIGQAMAGQQAGLQGLGQAGQLYGLGMQGAGMGLQGLQSQLAGTAQGIQGAQAAMQGAGLGLQGLQGQLAGTAQGMQGAGVGLSGIDRALAGTGQGMQGAQIGMSAADRAIAAGQLAQQGAQTGLSGTGQAMQGVGLGMQGIGQRLGAGQLGLAGGAQGIQGMQAGMQGAGVGLSGVGQALASGQLGLSGYDRALAGTGQGMQGAGVGLQGVSGALSGYGLTGAQGVNLANIANQQQTADLARMQFQNQLGGAQQAYEQQLINQAIQNYAMAQQYPYQQLAGYNALLRGYATPTTTTSQYIAQPNIASQLSGLGLTGAAMYGMTKKEGGAIKEKKYAEGGITSIDQKVINDPTSFSPEMINKGIQSGAISKMAGAIGLSAIENARQQAKQEQGLTQPPPQGSILADLQNQGIEAAPSNMNLAGGGIVAFDAGGLNDPEEIKRRNKFYSDIGLAGYEPSYTGQSGPGSIEDYIGIAEKYLKKPKTQEETEYEESLRKRPEELKKQREMDRYMAMAKMGARMSQTRGPLGVALGAGAEAALPDIMAGEKAYREGIAGAGKELAALGAKGRGEETEAAKAGMELYGKAEQRKASMSNMKEYADNYVQQKVAAGDKRDPKAIWNEGATNYTMLSAAPRYTSAEASQLGAIGGVSKRIAELREENTKLTAMANREITPGMNPSVIAMINDAKQRLAANNAQIQTLEGQMPGGTRPAAAAPAAANQITVAGKTFAKPPNMTDAQWEAYKKYAAGAK